MDLNQHTKVSVDIATIVVHDLWISSLIFSPEQFSFLFNYFRKTGGPLEVAKQRFLSFEGFKALYALKSVIVCSSLGAHHDHPLIANDKENFPSENFVFWVVYFIASTTCGQGRSAVAVDLPV